MRRTSFSLERVAGQRIRSLPKHDRMGARTLHDSRTTTLRVRSSFATLSTSATRCDCGAVLRQTSVPCRIRLRMRIAARLMKPNIQTANKHRRQTIAAVPLMVGICEKGCPFTSRASSFDGRIFSSGVDVTASLVGISIATDSIHACAKTGIGITGGVMNLISTTSQSTCRQAGLS